MYILKCIILILLDAAQKGAKGAVAAKATPKSAAKRKATTAPASAPKPKGRPKKVKKEESEDEEEDFVDEEEDDDDEEEDDEFDDEDDDDDQVSPKGKKTKKSGHYGSGASDAASKPGRRPGNHAKSFPDKDGKFELYLFKNDLVKDFRNDTKMCMWRRDGSSLLQKYIRIQDDDTNRVDVFFTASSVVSVLRRDYSIGRHVIAAFPAHPLVFLLGGETQERLLSDKRAVCGRETRRQGEGGRCARADAFRSGRTPGRCRRLSGSWQWSGVDSVRGSCGWWQQQCGCSRRGVGNGRGIRRGAGGG